MLGRFFALLLVIAMPVGAFAQESGDERLQARAANIVAVLNGAMAREDVFTRAFNDAVPEAQLRALTEQLTGQFGPLLGVEEVEAAGSPGAAMVALRYERAIARGQMQLETSAPYRVAGFRLTDFEPLSNRPVVEQLAELPGETAILLTPLDGSEPLLSRNAGQQMAIGSTFKLWVLSALVRAIDAGEHQWDEVVPLFVQSLPSGQLQDWPQGSPVTLHTLATMMISISDNTATDQLMAVLGRDAVEAELRLLGHSDAAATLPFLTTRELFVLKGDPALLQRYRKADLAERRDMRARLADKPADRAMVDAAFAEGPQALEVEWFASTRDIARVLDSLRGNDTARAILAVNSGIGPASAREWRYVGYKGGSEPGVLNFSWLLQAQNGEWHVLTMSWNEPANPVDEARFLGIAQRTLQMIEKR